MNTWLENAAQRSPEAPALIQDSRTLDYAGLSSQASLRARLLADVGVRPGDRVMLAAPITLETAVWLHALLWRGAAIIPLGPSLPPGDVAALAGRLQARALITLAPAPHSATIAPSSKSPDLIVIDAAQPVDPCGAPAAPAPWDPSRLATIVLTSGSRSSPKAVPLTLGNHAASSSAIAERLGSQSPDRWLLCLPLEHVGGLAILFRSVIRADTVVLMHRFDAVQFAETVAARGVTLTSLVPGMLAAILGLGGRPPPASLRGVFVGGAPAAPAVLECARRAGWPVIPTWGMTEAGSQLATPSPAQAAGMDFFAEPSVALPQLRGVMVRTSSSGALQVRGPMLFSSYLDDAEPGPDADGWFTTGDRGIVDAQNSVRVLGRIDDVIISGGINVHLKAVEQRLAGCPMIAEAAVVGVDDARWGQRVAAAVVLNAPESRLPDALVAWSRDHLQPAERPSHWRVVERIPKSSTGKPLTPAVKALFE